MRKKLLAQEAPQDTQSGTKWLDLNSLASVEVSSEDPSYPIEAAFAGDKGRGWRANTSGEQTIRLIFDQPTAVHMIQLRFVEHEQQRTQEFSLSYKGQGGSGEIVRQQWTFDPQGSPREDENYTVNLSGVQSLELRLKPDLQPERATASLASWRIA